MFRKSFLAALALVFLLPACQQAPNMGNKQTFGTLGGAALGGFLGSKVGKGEGQLAATAAGVVLGGWLGNEIGTTLDQADRNAMRGATSRAYNAPIGQQITWNNPRSGNAGTITPVRDGYASTGSYCREFQQTITVGGKRQQAYGKACRQADGSWKIIK